MKAHIVGNLQCECGEEMAREIVLGDVMAFKCDNGNCPQFGILYRPPAIEMEKFDG